MSYKDILQNLVESLPEIQGSFIFNEDKGIVASKEKTATNTIQKMNIGKHFSNIFSSINGLYQDINFIRINYRKMTVVGGQFHGEEFLLVLCDKDIPSGMTRMTMKMALNKLNDTIDSPLEKETEVVKEPTVNPDDLLASGSALAEPLLQIKDELTKLVGPVSDIVFDEALAEWINQTTPAPETLSTLLQILTEAIDDDNDAEQFKAFADTLR